MKNEKPHFTVVFERHGGIGDVLFTTPVLRYYRKHGLIDADDRPLRFIFCTQKRNHFILENLCIDGQKLIDEKITDRFPLQWRLPHKTVEDESFISACKENLKKFKTSPDAVISFFEAIERNDAANLVNAYDWHLQWAGIDPLKLSSEEKRPVYIRREQEIKAARKMINSNPGWPRIAVQMHASSLPRTWDKNDRLLKALCAKYPKAAIFSLGDISAQILELYPGERPPNYMPLAGKHQDGRLWGALIGEMNLLISVDSAGLHLAGALGVPAVGIFSTVPGWTRIRDYRTSIAIDSKYECAPCFRIGMECGKSVPTPGIEYQPAMNIRGKNEAYPCLGSITVEEVMEAVEKVLKMEGF